MRNYDVVIIGGGPAGMGAGIECAKTGAKTLIIERDNRLGGILNQCICFEAVKLLVSLHPIIFLRHNKLNNFLIYIL